MNDPWAGFVLSFVFLLIGYAFRFRPRWITKHSFGRQGFKLATGIIPNKRIILIFRFVGLAFLLMGIVALVISLHFLG